MASDFIKGKKWFLETSFPGVRRCKRDSFLINKEIFKGRSKFQNIFVFESPGFGKMLALDGIIQLSQSDEFVYHEMIVHPALISHSNPKKVLVVGGGDGGVLRELLKYPLEEIHFVEIDKEVVRLSKKHLPFISKGAFDNPRVKIFFEDGRKFIQAKKNYYDVIIVDSTDPVGPGKVLFKLDFYRLVYRALKNDGIAVFQIGPFLDFDLIIRGIAANLGKLFKHVKPLRLAMPSYSCGCEYCFIIASKKTDPSNVALSQISKRLKSRLKNKASMLKYYTPQMHLASMVMPKMWQLKK